MTKCTLSDRGIVRRSIVPSGVTAAWRVPAVTVVSAAPAFADFSVKMGASSNLSGTSSTATRTGQVVSFTVRFINTGVPATTPILTVKNVDANGENALQLLVATGWEIAGSSQGNGAKTLASAKMGSLPSGYTSVTFSVSLHDNDPSQVLTFSITTRNGGAYSAAYTL